jgi:CDP-diacylglycerol--glycerol-3-phosphate 3-phosphatidyltransferase
MVMIMKKTKKNIINKTIRKTGSKTSKKKAESIKAIMQSSTEVPIKKSIDWGSIINIPNGITSLRIIAAPFVMYMILNDRYAAAFFILLFAAITDSFDGKVARVMNKQTAFGAILDPFADVVLTTCTVIALLIQFHFPFWFGAIILFREAIIILGGLMCLFVGEFKLAKANLIGKLSRFFQLLSVIVYILAYVQNYDALWIYLLMAFTALLTLISTVMYLSRAYELITHWNKSK